MKKTWHHKLILWVIVLSLLGISIQATPIKRSDIPFSEMKYEKVQLEEVNKLIKEGKKLTNSNDMNKIQDWETRYLELYYKVSNNGQLAYLYYQLDNSSTYFYNEYIYSTSLIGTMKSEYLSLVQDNEETLAEDTKKYYDLGIKRQELQDQYNNLTYTVKVKHDNKEMDIIDIAKDTKMTTAQKTNLLYGAWYDAYNKQAAEIFLKLVKLDNERSKLLGYKTTAECMYDQYERDYSPDQAMLFSKQVKKCIPAIYKQLLKREDKVQSQLSQYTYTDSEDLLDKIEKGFISKWPQLKASYDYLRKYQLYDFSVSGNKAQGGFTTYLSGYNEPFISLNYDVDYETLISLIHEFGHFNCDYLTGSNTKSLDLAESYSLGMELLALPYHADITGSKEIGEAVKVSVMSHMIRSMIDGCIYDEFLQKVYANPNMTVNQLNNLYEKIAGEYGIAVDKREWVEVEHNFEMPFYYISYTMSAVAALEIGELSADDSKKGMDTYLKLIEKAQDGEFQKSLKEVGLSNPFEVNSLDKLIKYIQSQFGLTSQETKKAA